MPWRHRRSSVAGTLVAALAVVALGLVGSPAAYAHDYLVGSSPEQGTIVTTPPTEVVLEFNTSVGQQFAQVAVVGADGTTYQSGAPVVDGATVTQAVEGLPASGDVTVSYRVVSSDGHPIGGTVPFTIAGGSDPAPDDQATPTPAPSGQGSSDEVTSPDPEPATTSDSTVSTGALSDEDGVSPFVWVAAGALALALAAGAMALNRRRSRSSVDA